MKRLEANCKDLKKMDPVTQKKLYLAMNILN